MSIITPGSGQPFWRFVICLLVLGGINTFAEGVPDDCTQLMLGTAPTWNSMRGELRLFERPRGGDWKIVAGPFPVLFAKNGLAWGTGILGQNEQVFAKKNETAGRPREFSRSDRSLDTTPTCRPAATIRIIKLPTQTFGAMIRVRPITIATS
jgi:hypothetical protein